MENQSIQMQNPAGKLPVTKMNDNDFIQKVEQCIRLGLPLLIENVVEELDPALEPVLLKQVFKTAGIKQIKFGEKVIEYADDFRLYMTSRLSNPHYAPRITTKVNLINFMITFESLKEQLLNIVVLQENPQLDDERSQLIIVQYTNNKALKDTEQNILNVLKRVEGQILEDEETIGVLNKSKRIFEDIKKRELEVKKTQYKLD